MNNLKTNYCLFCLQECLLTSWAHWQGASSTMLKQPTTTYAGEKSSCTVVYNITIHSQPNKFRVLTNISPLLASNQRPPLRAPMATWSACLTKLPRCTTRWRSRRWRSCLRLDKGEEDSQDFRGTENFVHMKINDCISGKIEDSRSRSHNCRSVPFDTV